MEGINQRIPHTKRKIFLNRVRIPKANRRFSLLDAIITGCNAPVPTDEIIYNQAILDGIQKSSECDHEVEITIPEI